MFSGFYTLGSSILSEQNKMDMISNNMVNAQTPGYRGDVMELTNFEQELYRMNAGQATSLGGGSPLAVVGTISQYTNAGTIKQTGKKTDVALDGVGYFNIQSSTDENVTYLTRNGQFDVNSDGYLELAGYGLVLDDAGQPIQLENSSFTVGERGTIYDSAGEEVATLGVTVPDTGSTLDKLDNGMMALSSGSTAVAASGYRTVQGSIEQSNVNMNQEMTRMIETQRAYQLSSSAIKIIDRLNEQAATDIGAIS